MKKNENTQKIENLTTMLGDAKAAVSILKGFDSDAEKYYMFGILDAFTAKAEARKTTG